MKEIDEFENLATYVEQGDYQAALASIDDGVQYLLAMPRTPQETERGETRQVAADRMTSLRNWVLAPNPANQDEMVSLARQVTEDCHQAKNQPLIRRTRGLGAG